MSGIPNISLRQFQKVANEQLDGDVRLSREQNGLVNKGSLLHRAATVVFNLAESLGLIGDDNRAKRQESTVTSFAKALRGTYGDDIADGALQQIEGATSLTGRQIKQVIDAAKLARDTQIQAGRDMSVNPALYEEALQSLRTDLTDKVTEDLTKARREVTDEAIAKGLKQYEDMFTQRLQDRCRLESDLFRKELTDNDVVRFARQEADTIVNIDNKGSSFALHIRGSALNDEAREMFTQPDKEETLKKFVKDMQRLEELGAMPNVRPSDFAQSAFARELSTLLRDGDEKTLKDLAKMQRDLLKPDSFLARTYHDESTSNDTREAIRGLVSAMARVMTPITGSVDEDVRRITGGHVPPDGGV